MKPSHVAAIGLFVIIAGGIAWMIDRQRPVDEETLEELESDMLATSLDLQDQLTVDIDTRQLAEERARADSDEGIRLAGLCNAWIEFDSNHPSDETKANRDRACTDYRRFVETGELPKPAAD
jgi:hypothetical protein